MASGSQSGKKGAENMAQVQETSLLKDLESTKIDDKEKTNRKPRLLSDLGFKTIQQKLPENPRVNLPAIIDKLWQSVRVEDDETALADNGLKVFKHPDGPFYL